MRLDRSEAAAAVRVVYAGVAAYAVLFALCRRHALQRVQDRAADLGNMVQAIWNTLHGHFLETTTLNGHQRDRLGFHVDPFLLVLAPLFWIWSSPLLLLVVQALAVASGALPVFWLARKHLGSPRAGATSRSPTCSIRRRSSTPSRSPAAFTPSAIAVPLVLYAVWFLDEDRLVAFSVVALLAFTTKEEIPLAIGCLGIWYAVRKGHRAVRARRVRCRTRSSRCSTSCGSSRTSRPRASTPSPAATRRSVGRREGIAHKLFTDPAAFVHAVATGHKAGLPRPAARAVPRPLAVGAAALPRSRSRPGDQPALEQERPDIDPIPLDRGHRSVRRRGEHLRRRAIQASGRDALSLWVLVGAASVAIFSPIYALGGDVRALGSPLRVREGARCEPDPAGVPVSASNQLGGHLSERRYVYTFPLCGSARWIIVDINDPTYVDAAGLQALSCGSTSPTKRGGWSTPRTA